MFNERRSLFCVLSAILIALCFCGCDNSASGNKKSKPFDCFSVHFLDVGEGDSAFIYFSDGKTMLIDCAPPDQKISKSIIDFIKNGGVSRIDYLIFTHPDSDHVGNAVDIINSFEIGVAYIPDIIDAHLPLFPLYKSAVERLNEKEISINTSDCLDVIVGQDYGVAFLSPTPKSFTNSTYRDFNATKVPTEEQSNALSPIIYLQSQQLTFVFTGDAPEEQEKFAYKNSVTQSGYYQKQGVNVNLENVDFLKVSHHGSNDASCSEFVRALKPENAVISVSGSNNYGHPSDQVLSRLETANENVKIWRTDVHGIISVYVKDGQSQVVTQIS